MIGRIFYIMTLVPKVGEEAGGHLGGMVEETGGQLAGQLSVDLFLFSIFIDIFDI